MPNIRGAKKRVRSNKKKEICNNYVTASMKTAIKKFEKDVKEGKDVRREDYLVSTEKDYTSTLTKGTNKVSMKVNTLLKKGIEGMFRVLGSFVED